MTFFHQRAADDTCGGTPCLRLLAYRSAVLDLELAFELKLEQGLDWNLDRGVLNGFSTTVLWP